jgi:thiosulfate dehydrogenase [quinone] large subunit
MDFRSMDRREKGECFLAVLRIAIGWMMLWPFFDKLIGLGFATPSGSGFIDGGSPSDFVNLVAGGIFKDLFIAMGGNLAVDLLLMAALLIMGLTLILGIASRLTTIGMTAFLIVMYMLQVPPTDNPLIDHRITWILALWAVYYLGGYERFSIKKEWDSFALVQRYPILQR